LAIGLVTAACFHALARAYLNETTAWRDTLGFALRRAPQMLVIGLIYLGAFVGGFLVLLSVAAAGGSGGAIVLAGGAFLVLGVWLYVAWSVALPALLVEDARGLAALRRSSALIQGRWWQTFGVILVGVLIALVVTIVVQLMFAFVIAAGIDRSSLAALLIVSAGGLVALAITAPFQAALLVVLYIDLRVRREGFGLEELAARLGVDVVEEPAVAEAGFEPPPADDDSAPYWPAPDEPRPPLGAPGPVADLGPPPPGWRPPG
ncbi:MAG: hypothetical protein QOG15_3183, partial [Solirubrobacteraceae bacterium]|nr:hypothetical protein [Solirubrobacteraceae bacterium]